jgi:excisionase family DNA binding protein
MLTVKDLAERWSVSIRTVYELFNSGQLPGLRITPKNIRFREEDVREYENQRWNSSNTEVATPYIGEAQRDSHSAALLVRLTPPRLSDDSLNTNEPLTFGGVTLDSR